MGAGGRASLAGRVCMCLGATLSRRALIKASLYHDYHLSCVRCEQQKEFANMSEEEVKQVFEEYQREVQEENRLRAEGQSDADENVGGCWKTVRERMQRSSFYGLFG